MKYRVHRLDISITKDQNKLEQYPNSFEGEIVAIIPDVTPMHATRVDFAVRGKDKLEVKFK